MSVHCHLVVSWISCCRRGANTRLEKVSEGLGKTYQGLCVQSSTADTSSSAEQGHTKDNEKVSVDIPDLMLSWSLRDSAPVIDQDQGSSFSNSQSDFRATTAQP